MKNIVLLSLLGASLIVPATGCETGTPTQTPAPTEGPPPTALNDSPPPEEPGATPAEPDDSGSSSFLVGGTVLWYLADRIWDGKWESAESPP